MQSWRWQLVARGNFLFQISEKTFWSGLSWFLLFQKWFRFGIQNATLKNLWQAKRTHSFLVTDVGLVNFIVGKVLHLQPMVYLLIGKALNKMKQNLMLYVPCIYFASFILFSCWPWRPRIFLVHAQLETDERIGHYDCLERISSSWHWKLKTQKLKIHNFWVSNYLNQSLARNSKWMIKL